MTAIADTMVTHALSHGLMPSFKDQKIPTMTKEQYMELEAIFICKINTQAMRIHEYDRPMRLLQFIHDRAEDLYKTTLKSYFESGEEFIKLLENCYGNVSSGSKGVFQIINTWAITPYATDEDIIKRLELIKEKMPALADRAAKIIKDIPAADRFRNMHEIDDDDE